MEKKCMKCGSVNIIKNGIVFGSQRYKCKNCGYQFTKLSPAGKPIFSKLISHELYLSGVSMRTIAHIVGVTPQSVSRWIRKWHPAYMDDIGNKETLFSANRKNLLDCLDINAEDRLLVSSTDLPSGAKFNIVIQLPPEPQKH